MSKTIKYRSEQPPTTIIKLITNTTNEVKFTYIQTNWQLNKLNSSYNDDGHNRFTSGRYILDMFQ